MAEAATVRTPHEKPLTDVAAELGISLEKLCEIARNSGVIDGKRRENLEHNPRLVFVNASEVQRFRALLNDRRERRPPMGGSDMRRGRGPMGRASRESSTVVVEPTRKRRSIVRQEREKQEAEKAAAEAKAREEAAAKAKAKEEAAAKAKAEATVPAAPAPEPEEAKPAVETPAEAKPAPEETPPETPAEPEPAPVSEPERPAEPESRAAAEAGEQTPAPATPVPARPPRPSAAARPAPARRVDSAPGRKPMPPSPAAKDTRPGRRSSPHEDTARTRTSPGKGTLKLNEKDRRRTRRTSSSHRPKRHEFQRPAGKVVRKVEIPESIPVQSLAQRMAIKVSSIVSKLGELGTPVPANGMLEQETAALIAHEFGHEPVLAKEQGFEPDLPEDARMESRPPVVTVMGHVDHGKTSLLDHIRKTRVAAGESGGITQHVGVYRVETPNGVVLFQDTPGHELFSEMRARGAKVTDIVVLVVAADDGVMPQTKEAVSHAKAAGVPIIVAINKIDKQGANPDRIETELGEVGIAPEKWGGDSMFVRVSATEGTGIDELLEAILLQADVLELKAPADVPAKGVVVESYTDKGRGHLSTVIVQRGLLRAGDIVVCDGEFGRIRGIADENGNPMESSGPATPAVVQGLSGLPRNGSDLVVVDSERRAREIAQERKDRQREQRMASSAPALVPDLAALMMHGEKKSLNVIVKADVAGTLEAIVDALRQFASDEAEMRIVHEGIGGVTTSDVNLAQASSARVVAFNVRPDAKARKLAEERQVDIGCYTVIYEAIDDLRRSLSEMLAPVVDERVTGNCRVLEVFRITKVGNIAGCRVEDGSVRFGTKVRVIREGKPVYTGEIGSLKHFKEDVSEVRAGLECGIGVRRFNDFKVGDTIEPFEVVERPRELLAAKA